jgi:hypothetical protein
VSKLVQPNGQITVPGVKELIAPVTDDERKKFEAIHFQIKVGQEVHLKADCPEKCLYRISKLRWALIRLSPTTP